MTLVREYFEGGLVCSPFPTWQGGRLRVLGLTGNIASGKSAVAEILAGFGARVIDADRLVHGLYRAGTPTFQAIVDRFGAKVAGRGEIDRAALGNVMFGDARAMAGLEAIVHPAVATEIRKLLERPSSAPATAIEAIKLVESETVAVLDELWIVTASRDVRLRRLADSRGLDSGEATKRVDSQSSTEAKARLFKRRRPGAPVVLIDNDGDLDRTRNAVLDAWRAFIGPDGC